SSSSTSSRRRGDARPGARSQSPEPSLQLMLDGFGSRRDPRLLVELQQLDAVGDLRVVAAGPTDGAVIFPDQRPPRRARHERLLADAGDCGDQPARAVPPRIAPLFGRPRTRRRRRRRGVRVQWVGQARRPSATCRPRGRREVARSFRARRADDADAMRSYRYLRIDVFTDKAFGRNPLAVFPTAQRPYAREMLLLSN